MQLFNENGYKISRNIVIRQEVFGGLVFDRVKFVIYRLTPKAYSLLSYFYNPVGDFKELVDSIDITDNELTVFLDHSIKLNFLLNKADREVILPCTKYEFNNSLKLTDEDAKRCHATKELISTLRAPTFVWWDITYLCNLSCSYCYSNSSKELRNELDFESVCKILCELRNSGVFYVFFLGGEPLLRKDFIDILEYAQSIGLGTMLTSNGWFINESVANKLHDVGVSIARISIDGYRSSTHDKIRNKVGSWDKATNAVNHLVNSKIPKVGISPTITPENLNEIDELINWASEHNVDEIQISPLCATGRGKHLPELSVDESLKLKEIVAASKSKYKLEINAPEGIDNNKPAQHYVKHECMSPLLSGCGAGRNSMAISPYGEVYPCILKRDSVGNVLNYDKFNDFLQTETFLELRRKRESCLGCKFEDYCAGLCRIMSVRNSLDCKKL